MQTFAIDGGSLNGDPEVWFDESPALVRLQAAGQMATGLGLVGSAPVVLRGDLSLGLMARIWGSSSIVLAASGSMINGLVLGGSASVQAKLSGSALRWAMIEGQAPTVVLASGDIAAVPSISATFAVMAQAILDLKVSTGQSLEGRAPVVVAANLEAIAARSGRIIGDAQIQFAGIGQGFLYMASPPGATAIRLAASGDSRLGGKVQLEGSAEIGLYARGYLQSWHYVYANAEFKVGILARAERHGTPTIPGYYVEAPSMRALRVGEETRRFTVPAERRS